MAINVVVSGGGGGHVNGYGWLAGWLVTMMPRVCVCILIDYQPKHMLTLAHPPPPSRPPVTTHSVWASSLYFHPRPPPLPPLRRRLQFYYFYRKPISRFVHSSIPSIYKLSKQQHRPDDDHNDDDDDRSSSHPAGRCLRAGN